MDRVAVTQVIAMLVVLAAGLRWLPDPDPRNPLGLGDPQRSLALDASLEALGPDSDEAIIYLRSLNRPAFEQDGFRSHWRRLMRKLREIEAEADEHTLVQFKGVIRNDLWPLTYYLYPVPHTFESMEDGTSFDDPDLPEATHSIRARMTAYSELSPEELQAVQDLKGQDG